MFAVKLSRHWKSNGGRTSPQRELVHRQIRSYESGNSYRKHAAAILYLEPHVRAHFAISWIGRYIRISITCPIRRS